MTHKIRTKQDWLTEAKESLPKCKWFIEKYFSDARYNYLLTCAEFGKTKELCEQLNVVWELLPDEEFNIKKMPEGWNEFLNLIEFWNEDEKRVILEE